MTVGCSGSDAPAIIDPNECAPTEPCPERGGGYGGPGGPGGGGTSGAAGSGASAGTAGGAAAGSSGSAGSGAGGAGTGGAGTGTLSIYGTVATYDNDTFTTSAPYDRPAALAGQVPGGAFDSTETWAGSGTYSLSGLSNTAVVGVAPDNDASTWPAFHEVDEDDAGSAATLSLIRGQTLEDITLLAGVPGIPALRTGAQIVMRFTSSGAAERNVSINPGFSGFDGVLYDADVAWLFVENPTLASTDAEGLAIVWNVPAPAFPGTTVSIFYSNDQAESGRVDVRIAEGRVTFVDVDFDE